MKNINKKCALVLALPLLFVTQMAQADIGLSLNIENENERYKDPDSDAIASLGIQYRGEKFNIDKDSMSYDFIHSADNQKSYAVEVILKSNNSSTDIDDRSLFDGLDKCTKSYLSVFGK